MVTYRQAPGALPRRAAAQASSRRQFLGWTGAGAATVMGLTGCSGNASDTEETLTFTFWGSGAEKDAVSEVVNAFAQQRDLEGRPLSMPEEYETKLNTMLAGDTPPDAGYLTEGMAMRLGEQGTLYNVLENDAFSGFLPSTLHYYAPDKAVSQTCVEATALFYDAAALAEAGLTAPTTHDTAWSWDAFVAAADALTVDAEGRHPSESGFDTANVVRYGTSAPYLLVPMLALLRSNGVELFDEDGTRTLIDTDPAVQVMQAVNDLIFEHRVAPNAAQISEIGASTSLQLASGRVAMAIDGQWSLIDLNIAKEDGLNFDVAVNPAFGGDGAFTVVLSGANGAFNASNNKEAALELLVALADPAQVPLYENGLWMPLEERFYTDEDLLASWIDNDAHPPGYRTAVADMAMNNSVSYPSYRIRNFTEISTAFGGALAPMFTEPTQMRAACAALAETVNPLMQGVYQDSARA